MQTRLLIVGAGSAGRMAAREILASPEAGVVPVGFIDDDPAKIGTEVEGIPVRGGRDAIPRVLREAGAHEILIALPSAHGPVIREIVRVCESERVRFRIVPGIWEIIRGDVHIDHIRKVEPEDLLGRETVEPDPGLLASAYRGKRVLITGGGGSIGNELARQVLELDPERLILVGRGENSLFEGALSLWGGSSSHPPGDRAELLLLDLRRREALQAALERIRPHVILHCAAHKHVSFLERHPEEAVLNNVVATRDLLDVAETRGVERLIMLSTDKAVHPRSVMGATKRMAELLLEERHANGSRTVLTTVRFGNVLGSRGSVVRRFQHQIRTGGPVIVSHPEAARYFMTRKEAGLLVLEAGAMGKGGEVFILDMGQPIRILDLARNLITLSGFRPGEDVPVVIGELGPGEKVDERLIHDFEVLKPTRTPKIAAAVRTRGVSPSVEAAVVVLETLAQRGDGEGVVRELDRLLPEASLLEENPSSLPAMDRPNLTRGG